MIDISPSMDHGELKDLLDTGVLAESRFFLFRDYPTVTKVQKCLDSSGEDLFS